MSIHRILLPPEYPGPLVPGSVVAVDGDEAHHALRVKRLEAGDRIEILDGRGGRAGAQIATTAKHGKAGWRLEARIEDVRIEAASPVRLEVFAAPSKGERLSDMLESLSQLGVDLFCPLLTDHAVVDPREAKMERLRRGVRESMKQCGRAWPLEIGDPIELESARRSVSGACVLVADASGGATLQIPDGIARVAVFVGPEGGWSPREFEGFRADGWPMLRCAPHILRVETAAIAAATLLVNHPSLKRYTDSSTGA